MSSTLATVAPTIGAHFGPWGWGPGPWLLLIPLFWIIVFGIIFAIFGRRWRRSARENGYGRGSASGQAEVTLAERFAKGDIDEVEYRARLEVLRANAARSS
ncbi:SHOCT domain-containing protein [uncultured Microbacterium sp.]|uniref:SHOCT domain-containing protein n=1 Tax=uncultured Microbacterium sp. TaxID=191216 RepID=UPI0035CB6216